MIHLEGVSFGFSERLILNNINLHIAKNKVTVVMGGSGSGKTSLLRLIIGLCQPSSGVVKRHGWDDSLTPKQAMKAWRRNLGMLFQQGALFTDMNVFENVAFPLRELTNFSESIIANIVKLKLQVVGLRGAGQLMPSELSGGMARRVALARATVLDPAFMIYDEPFAGLDPVSTGIVATLIRQLNDSLGATSLLVSHDIASTMEIADYVYLIGNGKISAEGTPQELKTSTEPYTRQFLDKREDGPIQFHYAAKKGYLEDLMV